MFLELLAGDLSASLETDEEIRAEITCQPVASCSWSRKVKDEYNGINQNHDFPLNNYFEDRVCDDGKLYCCTDGTSPTDSQLKVLKNPSATLRPSVCYELRHRVRDGVRTESGPRMSGFSQKIKVRTLRTKVRTQTDLKNEQI